MVSTETCNFSAAEISDRGSVEQALASAKHSVAPREVISLRISDDEGYAWSYPADPAWWGFRGAESVEACLL